MAKFESLKHVEALERALKNASHLRAIDSAAVAEARRLAWVLDDPSFPIVAGKFDNVSPARYLDVLNALQLTPASRAKAVKEAATVKKPAKVTDPKVASMDAQRAKYRRG